MATTHAVRCAVVVVFSLASWCSFSPAQDSAPWQGVPDDKIATGIANASAEFPCDGKVRRLPADLFGKEYRGKCVDGVALWSWANGTNIPKNPLVRKGGKAKFAVFVVAINRRQEQASVVRTDFYVVSVDPKHPNDDARVKVAETLDPSDVAGEASVISPDIAQFINKSYFEGGAISPGGALSGFLYFGKVTGIHPWVMYMPKTWVNSNKVIDIPLGNWPIETGLAPQ